MTITMPTPALPVTGAPYRAGDRIAVEHFKQFRTGTVQQVQRVQRNSFGLCWLLTVLLDTPQRDCSVLAACDDNGRNRTKGQQVMPYTPTDAEL